jgi:hypothetical protein
MMRIGDRVQLKDPAGFPVTYHGKDGDPNGSVEVRTFTVKVWLCRSVVYIYFAHLLFRKL